MNSNPILRLLLLSMVCLSTVHGVPDKRCDLHGLGSKFQVFAIKPLEHHLALFVRPCVPMLMVHVANQAPNTGPQRDDDFGGHVDSLASTSQNFTLSDSFRSDSDSNQTVAQTLVKAELGTTSARRSARTTRTARTSRSLRKTPVKTASSATPRSKPKKGIAHKAYLRTITPIHGDNIEWAKYRASDISDYKCVFYSFSQANSTLKFRRIATTKADHVSHQGVMCQHPQANTKITNTTRIIVRLLANGKLSEWNQDIIENVTYQPRATTPIPVLHAPAATMAKQNAPMLRVSESEPQHDLCACMCMWNRGQFLLEWVEFHRYLGLKHLFLYDNNSTDNLSSVVKLARGYVSIDHINWQHSQTQPAANTHCMASAAKQCKWLMLIDVDEFVNLTPEFRVREGLVRYLESKPKTLGAALLWMTTFYPSGHVQTIPLGGVVKNYNCRAARLGNVKTIARVLALHPSLTSYVHQVVLREGFDGEIIKATEIYLNHYKFQVWDVCKLRYEKTMGLHSQAPNKKVEALSKTLGVKTSELNLDKPNEEFLKIVDVCEQKDTNMSNYFRCWLTSTLCDNANTNTNTTNNNTTNTNANNNTNTNTNTNSHITDITVFNTAVSSNTSNSNAIGLDQQQAKHEVEEQEDDEEDDEEDQTGDQEDGNQDDRRRVRSIRRANTVNKTVTNPDSNRQALFKTNVRTTHDNNDESSIAPPHQCLMLTFGQELDLFQSRVETVTKQCVGIERFLKVAQFHQVFSKTPQSHTTATTNANTTVIHFTEHPLIAIQRLTMVNDTHMWDVVETSVPYVKFAMGIDDEDTNSSRLGSSVRSKSVLRRALYAWIGTSDLMDRISTYQFKSDLESLNDKHQQLHTALLLSCTPAVTHTSHNVSCTSVSASDDDIAKEKETVAAADSQTSLTWGDLENVDAGVTAIARQLASKYGYHT